MKTQVPTRQDVFDLSRQAGNQLSPWFDRRLDGMIGTGYFPDRLRIAELSGQIIRDLAQYRQNAGVGRVWIGISGGVDSAVVANLFRMAGWEVTGILMPIAQEPEETRRGLAVCEHAGLHHEMRDLGPLYAASLASLAAGPDPATLGSDDLDGRIRRGNLRARLRMMCLYDRARGGGGLVASTDNYSELTAGFWTLHGDVGDLSPIQGLLKSWEVPALARHIGVPEQVWRARPTDGLGIAGGGDEEQIGCSYLEWDLMVEFILGAPQSLLIHDEGLAISDLPGDLRGDDHALSVFHLARQRLRGSWFKRRNPLFHRGSDISRFDSLEHADRLLSARACPNFL